MSMHLFAAGPENILPGGALACLHLLVGLGLVAVSVCLAFAVATVALVCDRAGARRPACSGAGGEIAA